MQHANGFCERTDHSDPLDASAERQGPIIFQQNDGLSRGLQRELPVRSTVDLRVRDVCVRHFVRRIEHPQPHPRGEQTSQRNVEVFFGEQTLVHGINKFYVVGVVFSFGEEVGTLIIHSRFQRNCARFGQRSGEVMAIEDVDHGIAIRQLLKNFGADQPDWDPGSRLLAFTLGGEDPLEPDLHVMMNMDDKTHEFAVPTERGRGWASFADTAKASPDDIAEPGKERPFEDERYAVEGRSIVILTSRET